MWSAAPRVARSTWSRQLTTWRRRLHDSRGAEISWSRLAPVRSARLRIGSSSRSAVRVCPPESADERQGQSGEELPQDQAEDRQAEGEEAAHFMARHPDSGVGAG